MLPPSVTHHSLTTDTHPHCPRVAPPCQLPPPPASSTTPLPSTMPLPLTTPLPSTHPPPFARWQQRCPGRLGRDTMSLHLSSHCDSGVGKSSLLVQLTDHHFLACETAGCVTHFHWGVVHRILGVRVHLIMHKVSSDNPQCAMLTHTRIYAGWDSAADNSIH